MIKSVELEALREEMKKNGVDAYIIPSSDPHQSEYVADHWKCREWISGFDGSAGTVVITHDHAGLWTDSRYFLQAEEQLKGSEFVLHKVFDRTTANYIKWINEYFDDSCTVAINGLLFSKSQENKFRKSLSRNDNKLLTHIDIVKPVWNDRKPLPEAKAFELPTKYAGLSAFDKIQLIKDYLEKEKARYQLVTSLDEIAWTLNIRSTDIDFNPLCISYLLVGRSESILFVNNNKVEDIQEHLKESGVKVLDYDEIAKHLSNITAGNILVDDETCNITLFDAMDQTLIKTCTSPIYKWKGVKNDAEISNFENSMIKDGVALCHSFNWLQNQIEKQETTEYDFSEKIAEFRSQQAGYKGESFPAIVGYESNGAVIHYRPTLDTSKKILPKSLLLCDSGGQYLDGTTDITRTIAVGDISETQKRMYTAVLKGHIDLAMAKFPKGTTGVQLDILARKHLWDMRLNYLHGTGHGVGFFLNVHEGPQGLSAGPSHKGNVKFKAGMVTSNEPGFYKNGEYGIRIENLIVCKASDQEDFLEFETITLYPIDKTPILLGEMEEKHKIWLNEYHRKVWDKLHPHLPENLQNWLEPQCSPI